MVRSEGKKNQSYGTEARLERSKGKRAKNKEVVKTEI